MREPAVPAPPHTSPPPPDRVRPRQTPFPESLQLRSHLGSQWKRRFLTEASHARETARFWIKFSRLEYIPSELGKWKRSANLDAMNSNLPACYGKALTTGSTGGVLT